jgi:hypothetical protein
MSTVTVTREYSFQGVIKVQMNLGDVNLTGEDKMVRRRRPESHKTCLRTPILILEVRP